MGSTCSLLSLVLAQSKGLTQDWNNNCGVFRLCESQCFVDFRRRRRLNSWSRDHQYDDDMMTSVDGFQAPHASPDLVESVVDQKIFRLCPSLNKSAQMLEQLSPTSLIFAERRCEKMRTGESGRVRHVRAMLNILHGLGRVVAICSRLALADISSGSGKYGNNSQEYREYSTCG